MSKWTFRAFVICLAVAMLAACAPVPAQQPQAPAAQAPAAQAPAAQQAQAPAAPAKKITVAAQVLTTEIEYFEQLRQAYIKAAKDRGIEISTSDAQQDPQKQVNFIEDAVAKKADVIVLSLVDAATAKPAIEEAVKKGVPVIVQGQEEQDFPWATANVGYSEETMGKSAAELVVKCLKERFPDLKTYNGVSCQWPDWPSTQRRDAAAMKTVEAGLQPATVNWVLKQKCGTRDWGLQTVEAALQKQKDMQFVVGVNDASSIGAVAAYESAGLDPKKFCFAAPNNDSEVRQYVADGKIYGTVDLNHQGLADAAMDLAVKLANKQQVPKMTYVDMVKVTKDNISNWPMK